MILDYGLDLHSGLRGCCSGKRAQNARSTEKFSNFVTQELQTWLRQGVVELVQDVDEELMTINGLTVAIDAGVPKRLCLHTLFLNDVLVDKPFHLPNVYDLASMSRPGDRSRG